MSTPPGRPHLHFTPGRGWMNDPNGLVHHHGRYHLFFQRNPHGDQHGNMSWGHATSPDLLHWTEHPIALWHNQTHDIFSGSVVVDDTNSAGWSTDQPAMIAIYTAAARTADHQAQALAYSQDGGLTWQHHDANPVLDLGTIDFRDPKVFRYGPTGPGHQGRGDYWVMVAVEAISRRVVFYRSTDLKTWTRLSSYGPAGAVGGNWECPDLFPLDVDNEPGRRLWVLLISLCPGGIAGGSGTQYVIGDFDGTTFTPLDELPALSDDRAGMERAQWLDWGPDCYAGVTYNGLRENYRTLIAWMSNWDYAQHVPTTPWRGIMTIPRRLTLTRTPDGYRLRQTPVLPEPVSASRSGQRLTAPTGAATTVALPAAASVTLTATLRDADRITLTVGDADNPTALTITYDPATRRLTADRRAVPAFHPAFDTTSSTSPLAGTSSKLHLQLVIDTTSVELFADHGTVVLTHQVFLGAQRHLTIATGTRTVVDHVVIDDHSGDRGGCRQG